MKKAFEVCDLGSKGEFTVRDLRHLIESRGYFVNERDTAALMEKFDKGSRRGAIIQSEFI